MVFELGRAGAAATAVGLLALICLVGVLFALVRRPTEDGLRRWLRAAAYFCACLLIGSATGVLDRVLTGSVLGDGSWGDVAFVAALLGCLVIEVVAYGVVWPIGTYTLDRPRDARVAVAFGTAWGIAESVLLLSFYAVAERTGWSVWAVVVVAFLAISAFQGVWHAAYWDVRVAPEHNDPAWNLRKVLLCHVPNLVATLSFLAVYRAPVLFIALQTVSLVLSCLAMRFPRPSFPSTISA